MSIPVQVAEWRSQWQRGTRLAQPGRPEQGSVFTSPEQEAAVRDVGHFTLTKQGRGAKDLLLAAGAAQIVWPAGL